MTVVPSTRRGRLLLGAAAALVTLVAGAVVVAASRDGTGTEPPAAAQRPPSTPAPPTAAPSTAATTSTTLVPPVPPFEGTAPELVVTATGQVTAGRLATTEATEVERLVFEPVLPSVFTVDQLGRFRQNTTLASLARLDPGPPAVVTYQLDRSAVWSDGTPIDCDDFRLAWVAGRGLLGRNGSPLFGPTATPAYAEVVAVECPDDPRVVRVELARPTARWRELFSHLVPAHVVAAASGVADPVAVVNRSRSISRVAEAWRAVLDLGASPETARLSGGPFRITDWAPGERVVLERNPSWWGVAPALDRLVVRLVPDAASQVEALRRGEAQVALGPFGPDDMAALEGLAAGGDATVFRYGTMEADELLFNLRNPLFQRRVLREAFAQCVPRQEIADRLAREGTGSGTVLGNLVAPSTRAGFVDLAVPVPVYDPVAARLALVADSWVPGRDGVLATKYKRLSVRLLRVEDPRSAAIAEQVTASCRRAGIEVIDEPVPVEEYDQRLADGTFDLAVRQAVIGPDPLAAAQTRFTAAGSANLGTYVSPDADALVATWDADLSPLPSPAARQLAEVLWRDLPALPITQRGGAIVTTARVWGVQPNPWGTPGWNAHMWRLDPVTTDDAFVTASLREGESLPGGREAR